MVVGPVETLERLAVRIRRRSRSISCRRPRESVRRESVRKMDVELGQKGVVRKVPSSEDGVVEPLVMGSDTA